MFVSCQLVSQQRVKNVPLWRQGFLETRNITRINVGLARSYVKLLLFLWKTYMCNLIAWYINKHAHTTIFILNAAENKSGGVTLPSTTSEMNSISTSQSFRSLVVKFHHRRPMACLSLNLYDTPGLASRMNVLFWGPGDFPVSYSNRDTLWNAWNHHSGSFMVDTGILLSNME